jgi:hypothetical protein
VKLAPACALHLHCNRNTKQTPVLAYWIIYNSFQLTLGLILLTWVSATNQRTADKSYVDGNLRIITEVNICVYELFTLKRYIVRLYNN